MKNRDNNSFFTLEHLEFYYEKLQGSIENVLLKRSATALAAHEKIIAIGTTEGAVLIIDFKGNIIDSFSCHTKKVNYLCFDDSGDFIASAGGDEIIVVYEICKHSILLSITGYSPDSDLCISPNFKRETERKIVFRNSEGKLVSYTKGWLRNKATVLSNYEVNVFAIVWNSTYLVWANPTGLTVCDTASEKIILTFPYTDFSCDKDFCCYLRWIDNDTFILAWKIFIKVLYIVHSKESSALKKRRVEILASYERKSLICGIAPFPRGFCVLSRRLLDREAAASLTYRGYENDAAEKELLSFPLTSAFCCLAHLTSAPLFVIISSTEVGLVRPRDIEDQLTVLLQKS
jgi:WD40 repeat protein